MVGGDASVTVEIQSSFRCRLHSFYSRFVSWFLVWLLPHLPMHVYFFPASFDGSRSGSNLDGGLLHQSSGDDSVTNRGGDPTLGDVFTSVGDDSRCFKLENGGWRRLLWLSVEVSVLPVVVWSVVAVSFLC